MGDLQNPERDPASTRGGVSSTATLNPERWRKIKEIFGLALERREEERNAFLTEACGSDESLRAEVDSLLASAAIAGAETARLFSVSRSYVSSIGDPLLNRRIGRYRLEERIGTGGMAVVYRAARADEEYQKQVAIKLLRPELDNEELLRRFRNERQTLATLDHPNIIRLLDGGTTEEELPYLVTDYVEGEPIDRYCDEHCLSITQRLRLFSQVCAGVRFAHQHLIIHRDLKPSNILVTKDGCPKLLDFGIAKVLDSVNATQTTITQTISRRMTPAYASPEQVRGGVITVASDIYSLGVVLYELLSGHRPYKLEQYTPAEFERAICEQEPERPSTAIRLFSTETAADGTIITRTPSSVSKTREAQPDTLQRALHGDLDNIVLTALNKDPQRRYLSVQALTEDIQRYLNHLPIRARRATLFYRTSKLVHRRKSELLTALAVLLFACVIAAALLVAPKRSGRNEVVTERSVPRRSIAVLGFKNIGVRADDAWLSTALSEMLNTELASGGKLRVIPGENVARTQVSLSLPDSTELSKESLLRVYRNLGSDFVVSGSYLDTSDPKSTMRLDLRLQDAARGETLGSLAETGTRGELPDLVVRAGSDLRKMLGIPASSPTESATLRASFPAAQHVTQLYAEGLTELRSFDALGARDSLARAVTEDPSFVMGHSGLSEAWSSLGYEEKAREEAKKAFNLSHDLSREDSLVVEARYREAERNWDRAIEIYRTLFNFFPDNIDYGLALAKVLNGAGKPTESLTTIENIRNLSSPAREDPRLDLAEANAARYTGDYKRELAAATRAVGRSEKTGALLVVGQAHIEEAAADLNLGNLEQASTASSKARELFAKIGDRLGESRALRNVGMSYINRGDFENARLAFQQAMQIGHELGNKQQEANMEGNVAIALMYQGKQKDAKRAYEHSLGLSREIGDRVNVSISLVDLGALEQRMGALRQAEAHLREAISIEKERGLPTIGPLANLGLVLRDEGNPLAAKKILTGVVESARHSGEKPGYAIFLTNLGDVELTLGDLASAEKHFLEALKISGETGSDGLAAYALSQLAEILSTRDDRQGARKKYEQAAIMREKLGEKADIAFGRLELANLDLDEGRVSQAEAAARLALNESAEQHDPPSQAEASLLLARCLLAEKKLSAAQEMIRNVRKMTSENENRQPKLFVDVVDAEIVAAEGSPEKAMDALRSIAEEAQSSRFVSVAFEARLALGKIQIASDRESGKRTLLSLEKDATACGFLHVMREAVEARSSRWRHRG